MEAGSPLHSAEPASVCVSLAPELCWRKNAHLFHPVRRQTDERLGVTPSDWNKAGTPQKYATVRS